MRSPIATLIIATACLLFFCSGESAAAVRVVSANAGTRSLRSMAGAPCDKNAGTVAWGDEESMTCIFPSELIGKGGENGAALTKMHLGENLSMDLKIESKMAGSIELSSKGVRVVAFAVSGMVSPVGDETPRGVPETYSIASCSVSGEGASLLDKKSGEAIAGWVRLLRRDTKSPWSRDYSRQPREEVMDMAWSVVP